MSEAKIGLIGTGFMGRAHAMCYSDIPAATLIHVSSVPLVDAQSFAVEFGAQKASDDWMKVVEDDDVEVVDVCAPNFLHAEIAIAAAKAGKHIIMEKPLALNIQDADRVMEAVEKAGIKTMYAENRRFTPVLTKTKQLIDNQKIGDLIFLRINELGAGPGHGGWFWDASKTGGGALIDLGIHGLFTAEWIMGSRIVEVSATGGLVKWSDRVKGNVEDTMMTNCRYENGAVGQLVCSWAISGGLDIRLEAYGKTGTIRLDQARTINGMELYVEPSAGQSGVGDDMPARPHAAADVGWSYPMVNEWVARGHVYELNHFVDCTAFGKEPVITFKDGYRCLQLVDAIYRSAAEGRTTKVPPIGG